MKIPTKHINPRPTQTQTVLFEQHVLPCLQVVWTSNISEFLGMSRTLRNAVMSDDEQASQEAQWVKNSLATAGDTTNPCIGKISLEEGIATHSNMLALRIP